MCVFLACTGSGQQFSSMPVVRNFVEDARKIDYVREALLGDDRFKFPCSLDADLNAALEWIAVRDPKQVYALPFTCRC